MPNSARPESFSTDLVPSNERLEAWLLFARRFCGECRFHFPKHLSFHGSIEKRALADAALTCFSSSPVSFVKFPIVTAHSADRDCIVITQLEGTRRYCQSGAVATLSPRDTTLIDAAQPWTSDCSDDCARLYLRVPRWVVEDHVKTRVPVLPRIIGSRGLGATLFHLATSLYEEAPFMSHEDAAAALSAYLAILSGCLTRPEILSTQLGQCAQLRPRIEHYIETHLGEQKLSPSEIAAAAGISVRHLHRLFAAQGCSVTEWIRERRLEHCRSDLANPSLSEDTITDIALSWGFSDSAHFSHCFRRLFGVSPRQFRSKSTESCQRSTARRWCFAVPLERRIHSAQH